MNYNEKPFCDFMDLAVTELPAGDKARRLRVSIGTYVESEITHQSGLVVDVIRSHRGIPVCVKVYNEGYGYDFIEMANVTVYEPYSSADAYTNEEVRAFLGTKISWREYLEYVDGELECENGYEEVSGA